ncbi:hypothetical protein N7533_000279 [Penicillium manginii]|uniref:uncharacterized protein n=1 Tax=Penicillium manginii TaxID=203109 RepID=UPI0025480736|nr:uncharacterized protein N7533_000279 [Penicillium manginii]KAJ5767696.1 hypothetical protein N7533_000279 [Penicillium manginii]
MEMKMESFPQWVYRENMAMEITSFYWKMALSSQLSLCRSLSGSVMGRGAKARWHGAPGAIKSVDDIGKTATVEYIGTS